MTRQELKTMFLQMDYSNVKEKKTITVRMSKSKFWPGYGDVAIKSDGPNGFSHFSTHQEHPLEYPKNCKEYKSGEYELIIDGEIKVPCSAELDNEWANESI